MADGGGGCRLGVDLGTTFTAAAIERDGQIRMVSLGLRQPEIPSVLAIRDGENLVGDTAERLAVARPEIMAREFKRRIGDSTAMIVDGIPWTAEALTGRLLGFVLEEVKRVEGEPPAELVVTHPANWGEFKLDRLRQAMLLAGCEDGTLMPEPVAAARYYASQGRVSDGQRLAVFDFGGGTFDAAIIESINRNLRVTGQPKGLERLGGIDLDQAVLAHVLRHSEVDLGDLDDTPANRQAVGRLRQDCRDAKETLSSDTTAIVPVMLPGTHSEVRITRTEFEKMIREPLLDAIKVVRAVIESARLDPADIDALLLVGGSSRIPYVAQMIGEELARPILADAHPKHTIAQGAVAQVRLGADERGDEPVQSPPASPLESRLLTADFEVGRSRVDAAVQPHTGGSVDYEEGVERATRASATSSPPFVSENSPKESVDPTPIPPVPLRLKSLDPVSDGWPNDSSPTDTDAESLARVDRRSADGSLSEQPSALEKHNAGEKFSSISTHRADSSVDQPVAAEQVEKPRARPLTASARKADGLGAVGSASKQPQAATTSTDRPNETSAGTVSSEPASPNPEALDDRPRRHRRRFRRRLALGVGLVGALVLLSLIVVPNFNNIWYVDNVDGRVVIMQGLPDGILWTRPHEVEDTGLLFEELDDASQFRVTLRTQLPSRDFAMVVVAGLREE